MARDSKAERLRRLFDEAMDAHRRGRFPEAERLYRQVLRRSPGHADALHLCGMAAFQQGDAERGGVLVEQAVARRPKSAVFRYTLGEIMRSQERMDDALANYDAAVRVDPSRADVHFQRGNVLVALGRAAEAVEAFRRSLVLNPEDAEACNNLGNALAVAGELDEAIKAYEAAARLAPDHAGIQANLGDMLKTQGRYPEAEAALRKALALAPEMYVCSVKLGQMLSENGRHAEALAVLKDQVARHSTDLQVLCDLGEVLKSTEAFDEAETVFRQVLETDAEYPGALAGLASCLLHTGHFDEAARMQQRVVELRPDFAGAHYALANNRRFQPDDAYLARLREMAAGGDMDSHERIQLWFALGRFEEGRGDRDAAFDAYRNGNRLHESVKPFDEAQFRDQFERIKAVFDADFFKAHEGPGVDSELPVFVLGMPRSGTTLVEQIISAHPQAFGAGELSHIRRMSRSLAHELGSADAFPECARELTHETAAALGESYVEGLRERGPGALRVTDKLPFNFVWLGLIATLLPRARIIHVKREPADTCLSCYFQMFEDGMRFAYDLGHLGTVYRLYSDLMAHWRRVLPVPMLDVRYEELVADQEAQSRRIIDFIGLPWDERCLQFHKAERGVRTASFWQVRQPLYRSSVARWRAYADHLAPLFEALGPLAPQDVS